MKRVSALHLILELIVILGYLVIGVSVLTYILDGIPMDRLFVGVILLSNGIIGFTDFFTWKFATKRKGIQSAVAYLVSIVLGAIFIIFSIESKLLCIMLGIFTIAYAVAKITTAALNLTSQPLINAMRIIVSIVQIVFSILLIVRTLDGLRPLMVCIGIALCVEAFILFVEFIIHRYQNSHI